MNINYKQPQFELFPGNTQSSDEVVKPRYLLANLTLSSENLVVLVILGIMVTVFFFSLGVERGKGQAVVRIEQKPVALVPVAAKAVIPVTLTPVVKTAVPLTRSPMVSTNAVGVSAVTKPQLAMPASAVKTAVPATTAQAVSPTVMSGQYTVQIASYKGEKFAELEVANLKKRGIIAVIVPKGAYSIVCVGNFARKEEANILTKKLKKKYKDCYVRRM